MSIALAHRVTGCLVVALTTSLFASSAFAQDPSPAPTDPAPVAAPPAQSPAPAATVSAPASTTVVADAPAEKPPTRLDDVRYQDANADRVILGSTAETHPKGTFFVSDYEILLVQLGYAVTDDLQLSVSGVPPLIKDQPYFFDFGAKLNLVRGTLFRAAVLGAFDIVTTGGDNNDGPYYGGRLGAVGQFCFNETCRSSLSANAGTILSSGSSNVLPVYGSLGAILNAGKVVSFLAEPALLGAFGTGDGSVSTGAVFAMDYGIRLGGPNFAADLTFLLPVAETQGSIDNPFILGYPFLAFTYRTDGDARNTEHASMPSTLGQRVF